MTTRLLRPLLLALVLLTPASAAAPSPSLLARAAVVAAAADPVKPKAFISGPATVKVNSWVWLDVTGSVSVAPMRVITLRGPDKTDPQLHYNRPDASAVLLGAMLKVQKPGVYRFLAIAAGDIVPPAVERPEDFADWDVTVTPDEPGPVPPIPPGPGPTPPPVPPTPPIPPSPVPVPQSIKLIAAAVYSGDTTSAAEREFATARDSLTLTNALASINVEWHVMDRVDPRLGPKTAANPNGCNIGQFLAPVGINPQMIIYDTGNTSNSLYDAAGARVGQKAPASFDAPRTEAAILAMFKKIRGVTP